LSSVRLRLGTGSGLMSTIFAVARSIRRHSPTMAPRDATESRRTINQHHIGRPSLHGERSTAASAQAIVRRLRA